nr:MAG TPA: hypothetical protein [Bacteriophage sp.]
MSCVFPSQYLEYNSRCGSTYTAFSYGLSNLSTFLLYTGHYSVRRYPFVNGLVVESS